MALAVTLTSGKAASEPGALGAAGWMLTAVPSTVAVRPLPASRRSSAWRAVSGPATAGAVLPATSDCCTTSCAPAWRAQALSASPSGWAGRLMGMGEASGAKLAPCAQRAPEAKTRDRARASGAGRGVKRCMGTPTTD